MLRPTIRTCITRKKRSTTWIGYKVHLTETCDDRRPHLITHVEMTPAPVVDRDALQPIYAALAGKDLLPGKHLVDAGYVDADQLVVSARDYGVDLIGPTPKHNQWQARTEGAFTVQDLTLDWDKQAATCPAGHISTSWTADANQGRTVMRIRFSTTDCKICALKPQCTRAPRRLLTPRRRKEHVALEAARVREAERPFVDEYRRRAGIEGTLSLGTRTMHLRRSRYIGLAKTHLQHVLTAAATNLGRLSNWLAGTPRERTRPSAFVRLMDMPISPDDFASSIGLVNTLKLSRAVFLMPKSHPPCSPEFRRQMVELVRAERRSGRAALNGFAR